MTLLAIPDDQRCASIHTYKIPSTLLVIFLSSEASLKQSLKFVKHEKVESLTKHELDAQ
jgi:hypothetical protein